MNYPTKRCVVAVCMLAVINVRSESHTVGHRTRKTLALSVKIGKT